MPELPPKELITDPIVKPIEPIKPPTHGPRPLAVKGSCWCPVCESKKIRTRMRRECKREGLKWVETGRFCPICQRWFSGSADLKVTAPTIVDRPVRPLLLNRERSKERILAAVAVLYPGKVDLIKEEP